MRQVKVFAAELRCARNTSSESAIGLEAKPAPHLGIPRGSHRWSPFRLQDPCSPEDLPLLEDFPAFPADEVNRADPYGGFPRASGPTHEPEGGCCSTDSARFSMRVENLESAPPPAFPTLTC